MYATIVRKVTACVLSLVLACGLSPILPSGLYGESAYASANTQSFSDIKSVLTTEGAVYISYDAETDTLSFTGKGTLGGAASVKVNEDSFFAYFTVEFIPTGEYETRDTGLSRKILEEVQHVEIGDGVTIASPYFEKARLSNKWRSLKSVVRHENAIITDTDLLQQYERLNAGFTDSQGITYADATMTSILSVGATGNTIAIPASVTSINADAFKFCEATLKSITVASGNTTYQAKDGVLYKDTDIVYVPKGVAGSVEILDGVTVLKENDWANRASLQALTIPASVTSIKSKAFAGDSSLKRIVLGAGSSFKYEATTYYDAQGAEILTNGVLTNATGGVVFETAYPSGRKDFVPDKGATTANVQKDDGIFDGSFAKCFETINNITSSNPLYVVSNNVLYSADMKTLYKVPASATGVFQVPNTVTHIAPYAFAGCSKLTQIVMPSQGVEDIGKYALRGTHITSFTLPSTLWQNAKAEDFPQDPVVDYTLFNAGTGNTHESQDKNINTTLEKIDFDLYRQSFLPNYAFSGLKLITSITLPKSVASLGKGTFYGCPNLNTVYTFNQNLQVSTANRTGDATLGWSEATPSSFSTYGEGSSFVTRTGITFYALNFASNMLKKYCDENGSTFVPMAFLGNYSNKDAMANKVEGGESTLNALTNSNTVSISNMVATGAALTPTIKVKYTNDPAVAERVLQPGTDCTVAYTDSSGKTVSSISAPGTYTATVKGDEKSVFGTAQVTFRVLDASERNVPPITIEDTWNTGAKATANFQGSAVEGATAATLSIVPVTAQNDPERYNKLMAAMGAGELAGLFSVNLHVDGEHIREGFGSITLSFPVDAGFNGRTATVHHLHEDGTVTDTTAVVTNGMVTITVTSLSDFAIEVTKQSAAPQQQPTVQQAALPLNQASAQTAAGGALPQTGDNTHGVVGGVTALAALSTGLALFARRKRVKYER